MTSEYRDMFIEKYVDDGQEEEFKKIYDELLPDLGDLNSALIALSKLGDQIDGDDVNITCDITKVDEEKRLVFGWFSVAKIGDDLVEDSEGDLIEIDDLEKAAYEFVKESRIASDSHQRMGVGTLVESIMFTKEKQDMLGIDLGKEGWFGGFYIQDDKVWKSVKENKFKAFSIGGKAVREEVE